MSPSPEFLTALRYEHWTRLEVSREEVEQCLRDPTVTSDFKRSVARFLRGLREGDTLVRFRSPPITWQRLMGSEGYAIERGGKPVELLLTSMN